MSYFNNYLINRRFILHKCCLICITYFCDKPNCITTHEQLFFFCIDIGTPNVYPNWLAFWIIYSTSAVTKLVKSDMRSVWRVPARKKSLIFSPPAHPLKWSRILFLTQRPATRNAAGIIHFERVRHAGVPINIW